MQFPLTILFVCFSSHRRVTRVLELHATLSGSDYGWGVVGLKKPGRVRHIARRAPASSLRDAESYSEALKTSVPRGAHGVGVGDQLIETQVGDVDDLAEREASLAGGGVLDAAPARGQ